MAPHVPSVTPLSRLLAFAIALTISFSAPRGPQAGEAKTSTQLNAVADEGGKARKQSLPVRERVILAVERLVVQFKAALEPEPERTSVLVHLRFPNLRSEMELELPFTGKLGRKDARRVKKFLRCRRTGRRHKIAPGLLAIIADLGRQYEGHTIEVVSGFRAPPYGVRRSKHFRGHAIDLRVVGVPTTEVRDYLWQNHTNVGVGHYIRQDFIHVDYRPRQHDVAWSSKREGAPYRLNPRWARVERPVLAPPVEDDHGHGHDHGDTAIAGADTTPPTSTSNDMATN